MEDAAHKHAVSFVIASYNKHVPSPSIHINRETLDKFIQTGPTGPNTSLMSGTLSPRLDLPPPLDPKDYPMVRFWTAKSFETYCNNLTGETDGLATQQKRRGRRRKSDSSEDRHPYLESIDGSPVLREVLVKVGQKARRLWQSMNGAGIAPSSWGKASENAYLYFVGEMLNVPEFEFFRFCEGNWKITRWATKAYASWTYNHFNSGEGGNCKTVHTNKRKRGSLDDPSLLRIEDDKDEDTAPISSWDSSPVQSNFDSSMLLALSASTSVHIQVCLRQL